MSGGGLEAMVKIQIDLKTKNHPDDVACVVDTGNHQNITERKVVI